nr:radical SAM protein [Propionibacterium sp.]
MSNHAIVDAGNRLVVYLTQSRKIFRVPTHLRSELEALCDEAADGVAATHPSLAPIAAALRDCAGPHWRPASRTTLRKLSLNVTNACNMACRYCYANEGEYGSPQGMMTREVARQSVDALFDHFETIGAVQFFGGEPLLNVPAIEAVCEALRERHATGRLAELPLLGLVTNGTIVNERVERVLEENRIHVTVSFDGPPDVNDRVRPLKGGRVVGDAILENARRLAAASGQPVGVEATWSRAQQDAGLSLSEMVGYLRRAFDTQDVHVAPVCLPDSHPLQPRGLADFPRSVPAFTEQVLNGDYATFSKYRLGLGAYVRGLASDIFCDAGLGVLSVGSTGRVYPCFMFIDDDEFDMGSVFDPDLFTGARFRAVYDRFATASKRSSEQCGPCAFRTVCSGCLGANRIETGDPFRVSEETCRMNHAFHEAMLVAADRVSTRG